MARYQYAGPGPIEVLSGGDLIRPGDVREYDSAPDWGPWERLDGPDTGDAKAPPPLIIPSTGANAMQPGWPATPPVTPEGKK